MQDELAFTALDERATRLCEEGSAGSLRRQVSTARELETDSGTRLRIDVDKPEFGLAHHEGETGGQMLERGAEPEREVLQQRSNNGEEPFE